MRIALLLLLAFTGCARVCNRDPDCGGEKCVPQGPGRPSICVPKCVKGDDRGCEQRICDCGRFKDED